MLGVGECSSYWLTHMFHGLLELKDQLSLELGVGKEEEGSNYNRTGILLRSRGKTSRKYAPW